MTPTYHIHFRAERVIDDGTVQRREIVDGTTRVTAPDAKTAARTLQARAEELRADLAIVDVRPEEGDA